jgi:uncharacterized membrane protein (UPF0127 family)
MDEDLSKSEMKKRAIAVALVLMFPVLLYAVWHFSSPKYYETGIYGSTDVYIASDGKFVSHALIADSPQKRSKGLMGRTVNETGGMLFVFENSGKYVFTMRDMDISIDMVFIDSKKKIVDIESDVPPMSSDPSTWGSRQSDSDCLYVLELMAGRASSLGIAQGISLNFTL